MSAELKMAKRYEAISGKAKALPWAAIIQLILTLLGGCSAKGAKRFARRHPDALEDMLANKLREEGGHLCKGNDVAMVAVAAVQVFNAASVAEIESMAP